MSWLISSVGNCTQAKAQIMLIAFEPEAGEMVVVFDVIIFIW